MGFDKLSCDEALEATMRSPRCVRAPDLSGAPENCHLPSRGLMGFWELSNGQRLLCILARRVTILHLQNCEK